LTRDIFTLDITESPRKESALFVVDEMLERFEIQSTEEFRKESSRKVDLVFYLTIAARILCLISGFSRKTDSARFEVLLSPRFPNSNSHPDSRSSTESLRPQSTVP